MLFNDRNKWLINQDLIFRCHKIHLEKGIAHTKKEFQWEKNQIYEVEFNTNISCFYIGNENADSTLKIIYKKSNIIFYQGDIILCLEDYKYHSINGLDYLYLDYNAVEKELEIDRLKNIPDSLFAKVVKLNQLEYLDYLYGS